MYMQNLMLVEKNMWSFARGSPAVFLHIPFMFAFAFINFYKLVLF